jgi:EpsI family protein
LYRYRFLILNSILLLTLLGSQWGRHVEAAGVTHTDSLQRLTLSFRDWTPSEMALTPAEVSMLEPDAVLLKLFSARSGEQAQLAVIAGHRKKSVHTPGFCMAGGGWETLWQKDTSIAIRGKAIPATQALMEKDGQHLLATYFFTNGEYCTRNLLQFQSVQFFKRFGSEIPVGALVRIIVPVRADEASAVRLSDEFAAAVLPPTLNGLHQMHLHDR